MTAQVLSYFTIETSSLPGQGRKLAFSHFPMATLHYEYSPDVAE